MAITAMTTSSSIKVKAWRKARWHSRLRFMTRFLRGGGIENLNLTLRFSLSKADTTISRTVVNQQERIFEEISRRRSPARSALRCPAARPEEDPAEQRAHRR